MSQIFQCPRCSLRFLSESEAKDHLSQDHPDFDPWVDPVSKPPIGELKAESSEDLAPTDATKQAADIGPFTYYGAFKRHGRDVVDVSAFQDDLNTAASKNGVAIRGVYSALGFRTDSDLAMWWTARSADDIQAMLADLNRTGLGARLTQSWAFFGMHRPPEVAKDHVPAFLQGTPPKRYVVIYPFVRTVDWYLMPRDERAKLLREHGEMGREFPEILANTTSGFALGDWEWILAFEADDLSMLVDCMRRLRDAEARRYTKEDTPFITGIRGEAKDVFSLLW